MDDLLRRRILEMSRTLAVEEKERLEAAGMFVDLERLTMEIGDELARQLAGLMLSSRTEEAFEQKAHCCPDCGKACDVEAEPAVIAPPSAGFFPVAKVPQRPPRQNVTPLVLEKNEAFDWRELAPELLSREVIASGEDAEDFGRHHATVAAATSTHLPVGRRVPGTRFSNSAPTPSATPDPSIHSGFAGETDRPERTRTETSLPNHAIRRMHR